MLTDQELQTLRNLGNESESASNEIAELRAEVEAGEAALDVASAEVHRLRAALVWIEQKARAHKLEIAPSLLGSGFEFGFWPAGTAKVVNAKTLLDAVEAAQRAERST